LRSCSRVALTEIAWEENQRASLDVGRPSDKERKSPATCRRRFAPRRGQDLAPSGVNRQASGQEAVRGAWQRPGIEVGLRLGDLPLWATAGVKIPSTKEGWSGQIGLRAEF
jgi:hypothetical protein